VIDTALLEKKGVPMSEIKIEKRMSMEKAREMGIDNWPIWEKEESDFPWTYDTDEVCYVLEGKVIVTPDGGQPVEIGKGDFVRFPKGMSCRWEVKEKIRKHYDFP
jgi:uncharacterized cupin superfamily protein